MTTITILNSDTPPPPPPPPRKVYHYCFNIIIIIVRKKNITPALRSVLSTLVCPNTHTKTFLVCVLGQASVLN